MPLIQLGSFYFMSSMGSCLQYLMLVKKDVEIFQSLISYIQWFSVSCRRCLILTKKECCFMSSMSHGGANKVWSKEKKRYQEKWKMVVIQLACFVSVCMCCIMKKRFNVSCSCILCYAIDILSNWWKICWWEFKKRRSKKKIVIPYWHIFMAAISCMDSVFHVSSFMMTSNTEYHWIYWSMFSRSNGGPWPCRQS